MPVTPSTAVPARAVPTRPAVVAVARRRALHGWAYAAPTALLVVGLFVLPVLLLGQMSLSDWPLLSGNQGLNAMGCNEPAPTCRSAGCG